MLIGLLTEQEYLDTNFKILKQYGVNGIIINSSKKIENIDGLIISGSNFEILKKKTDENVLINIMKKCFANDTPLLVINAGILVIAKSIRKNNTKIRIMDFFINNNIKENLVGKKEIYIPALDVSSLQVSFNNSPFIRKVAPNVGILSQIEDKIILARQGNFLVCCFQAEEMQKQLVHKYFIKMIKDAIKNKKNT